MASSDPLLVAILLLIAVVGTGVAAYSLGEQNCTQPVPCTCKQDAGCTNHIFTGPNDDLYYCGIYDDGTSCCLTLTPEAVDRSGT